MPARSSSGNKASSAHVNKVISANDSNYLSFGKYLADSDKKVRDAAVKSLGDYLSQTHHEMSNLDILKLCKGLFYCFWMSDKPLIQQELAVRLASFILSFKSPSLSVSYIQGFWEIVISEWYKVDKIRLDKFYNLLRQFHYHTFLWLDSQGWEMEYVDTIMSVHEDRILSLCNTTGKIHVPDSLRYHTVESFFSELNKAIENGVTEWDTLVMDRLQRPFLLFLAKSPNDLLVQRVFDLLESFTEPINDENETEATDEPPKRMLDSVLDIQSLAGKVISILEQPDALKKNKKLILDFCKPWCQVLGIDFHPPKDFIKLPKTMYGDFKILKEAEDVDSLISKKRSREEVDDDDENEADSTAQENVESPILVEESGKDISESISHVEETSTPVDSTAQIKKKKKKKNKNKKAKVAAQAVSEQSQESSPDIPKENAMTKDTESGNESPDSKKSVRWQTTLRVKRFFKRKPIGAKVDPLKNAKSLEPHLKPVLKRRK